MRFPDITLQGKHGETLTDIKADWNALVEFVDGISRELEEGDLEWFKSRSTVSLACLIDRLLLLISGSALSLGANNLPSAFASTRSAMEVTAHIVYLLHILELDITLPKRIEMVNNAFLQRRDGDRPKSKTVTKDVGIMAVIDVADEFLKKTVNALGWDKDLARFRVEYETLCNFDHPNFDSHLSVGSFKEIDGKVRWYPYTKGEITNAMAPHIFLPIILTLGVARITSSRVLHSLGHLQEKQESVSGHKTF